MLLNSNDRLISRLESVINIVEASACKSLDFLVESDLMGLSRDALLEARVNQLGFLVLEMKLTFSKELKEILITPDIDDWAR
jgi:hypothetical protein